MNVSKVKKEQRSIKLKIYDSGPNKKSGEMPPKVVVIFSGVNTSDVSP